MPKNLSSAGLDPIKQPKAQKSEPETTTLGSEDRVWERRYDTYLDERGPNPLGSNRADGLKVFKKSWQEAQKSHGPATPAPKTPHLGPFADVHVSKIPRGVPGGPLKMDDSCGNFP